jgi:hypothetical protein
MWDFASLKPEEVEKVRKAVASVTVRNNYKDYNDAPISERLAIAEKMYHVLRGKPVEDDAAFWSQFYRVEGYHYARENKPDMARQARLNSLALTRKLIDDDKEESRRKEHLLVAACMKHFTGDDTGAIADLDAAAKLSYKDSSRSEDEQSGYDQYLADLIKSYKAAIQEKKVPEDLGGPE